MENWNKCSCCGQSKRKDICDQCKKDITDIKSRIYICSETYDNKIEDQYYFCNKECLLTFLKENEDSLSHGNIEMMDSFCCENVQELEKHIRNTIPDTNLINKLKIKESIERIIIEVNKLIEFYVASGIKPYFQSQVKSIVDHELKGIIE